MWPFKKKVDMDDVFEVFSNIWLVEFSPKYLRSYKEVEKDLKKIFGDKLQRLQYPRDVMDLGRYIPESIQEILNKAANSTSAYTFRLSVAMIFEGDSEELSKFLEAAPSLLFTTVANLDEHWDVISSLKDSTLESYYKSLRLEGLEKSPIKILPSTCRHCGDSFIKYKRTDDTDFDETHLTEIDIYNGTCGNCDGKVIDQTNIKLFKEAYRYVRKKEIEIGQGIWRT